jgi:short-subunit dehydrogenase
MPTALVTGASSGIGLAFARALAAKGHDIVAVARDKARLEALAAELPTAVEVLAADLCDASQLRAVEERLADGAPVELLVNNAGFGANSAFVEHDPDAMEAEIRLNVLALTRLARAVLPRMLAAGAGGIVNVSSTAGFQPGPGFAVYAATKAYVTNLSEALHEEARGRGVRVLALCPGFTRTEFQARNKFDASRVPDAAWSTPEQVVDEALRALARGHALCIPGLPNKAVAGLSHVLPRAVVRRVAGLVADRL